ncbi:helix-turn-helix transcriptional regulator [Marinomonas algarum]|uniref:Helix-turn-helix domain-containing protein n=1 Tax=Marinomonas algarum TaxID=2883105 RepID=A0A9X1LF07_9GAMM|nr:helix-turn-helix transcriptional regulator [Marinomonas algarum]MCB5162298.1 helix-turn-helix domain-containing protein [Marinomonas algarum]
MKMKDQLDSAQPLKKHKVKAKKSALKKKKQDKEKNVITSSLTPQETLEANSPLKVNPSLTGVSEEAAPTLEKTLKVRHTADQDTQAPPNRQRASKTLSPMSKEEQLVAVNQIIKRLLIDEITQGEALKALRVGVLGIRQDAYTKLCGVSRKTLSEIENDKGNYTADIINKVFAPFDLKVGLVPTSSQLMAAILTH